MKTVLVTGGAGFIGSHLCDALIKQGNRVICMDNFASSQAENINYLLENKDFRFIKHDVVKAFNIREKIDQIYHLASRASPVDYQKFPVGTALSNSIGTYNLVKLSY